MSSKVLNSDQPEPIEPIVWRQLTSDEDPGQAPGPMAEPATPGPDPRELEELHARIAELERECQQREQNALRAGTEKGHAAGVQEASARLNPVIERFAATINDLAIHRKRLRHDAEADVVKLAIAIARRVLRRELNTDPEAMLGLVKAALEQLDNREVDRVRVCADDVQAVKANLERLRPGSRVDVVSDPHLERGAAIFETARGNLDTSVETQLREIEQGLVERLRS